MATFEAGIRINSEVGDQKVQVQANTASVVQQMLSTQSMAPVISGTSVKLAATVTAPPVIWTLIHSNSLLG